MAPTAPCTQEKVLFTPVAWEVNFRRTLKAPWAFTNVIAVSPTKPTRLLLYVDHTSRPLYLWQERELKKLGKTGQSDGGASLPPPHKELTIAWSDFDLWLSDPDGSHARFLHHFRNCWINSLAWSPDGSALLYQLAPYRIAPYRMDNKQYPTQVHVLNIRRGKQWMLADQGEEFPAWSADSHTVFFWRKMADAVVTPDRNLVNARWQLFRADSPWDKSTVRVASATAIDGPSPLSPSGTSFLYTPISQPVGQWLSPPQVMETFPTGLVTPLVSDDTPPFERHADDPPYLHPPSVLWSGNSRWVFSRFWLLYGGVYNVVLYNVVRHKSVDLYPLLTTWAETVLGKSESESLAVLNAAWFGGEDNRLLIELETYVFPGDFGSPTSKHPPPKHGWVVYDPAAGKLLPIAGLPKERQSLQMRGGGYGEPVLYRIGSDYLVYPHRSPGFDTP